MDFNVNGGPGFWRDQVVGGGATPPVDDGGSVTVKPANGVSATYQGTYDDGAVTLPSNVAMTADAEAVGLWNASDDSRGNGAAFVNVGALTAVRLPAQNDVVGNGASVIVSKADNTGTLATGTANVPANTNTFENVALPQNYAVIQDGAGSIDILDYGAGGGQVAGVARVSGNAGNVQLANSTTKIAINAAPATVTAGGKTAGITFAIDQGGWQNFPFSTATDSIVKNGDTIAVRNSAGANSHNASAIVAANAVTGVNLAATTAMVDNAQALTVPVTGTYTTTATITVANGVVTAIALS